MTDREQLRQRHAAILRRAAQQRVRERAEELREILEDGAKPGVGRGALAWLAAALALVWFSVLAAPWVVAWVEAMWGVRP